MWRNFNTSEERAIGFAYTFMGTRIQCAQCHKHPFDVWTKADFEQFELFFERVRFARGGGVPREAQALIAELGLKDKKGGDLKRRVVVRQGDARQLSRYADGSIHKIVTDPPWGSFQELADGPETFYREVLAELARVLAPGGLLVLLLARADFLGPLLETLPALERVESWPILVSGKKAVVYKLRKGTITD